MRGAVVNGVSHSGRRPEGERKHHITRIQDYHQEIMRLMACGWSNKRLHETFDISLATLCNIRNSPITRRQIDLLQASRNNAVNNAQEVLEDTAMQAALTLKELLHKEGDDKLRKECAIAILDRTNHGPTHKIKGEFQHAVFNLNKEDVEDLRDRMENAVKEGIIVEDAELVEEAS